MKKLIVGILLALFAGAVVAETDYQVSRKVFVLEADMEQAQEDITGLQAGTLESGLNVTGDGEVSGNLTVGSNVTAGTSIQSGAAYLSTAGEYVTIELQGTNGYVTTSGRVKTTFTDSASNPAYTIGSNTNGFEDVDSDSVGFVINGSRIGEVSGDGLHFYSIQGYLAGHGVEFQYDVWDYTTNAIVLTANDYNQIQTIHTNAAVAITLPANGAPAGTWIDVAVHGAASDDCAPTIAAATADTLITTNSADSDSVTYGSGHRIGAHAHFWSDGSFWHAENRGGTTMTVNDSD